MREWVGSSKKAHPDFLWLPTAVGSQTVAGGAISYAQVKSLVDESVTEPGTGGTDYQASTVAAPATPSADGGTPLPLTVGPNVPSASADGGTPTEPTVESERRLLLRRGWKTIRRALVAASADRLRRRRQRLRLLALLALVG